MGAAPGGPQCSLWRAKAAASHHECSQNGPLPSDTKVGQPAAPLGMEAVEEYFGKKGVKREEQRSCGSWRSWVWRKAITGLRAGRVFRYKGKSPVFTQVEVSNFYTTRKIR